jgi:hypothetical protein
MMIICLCMSRLISSLLLHLCVCIFFSFLEFYGICSQPSIYLFSLALPVFQYGFSFLSSCMHVIGAFCIYKFNRNRWNFLSRKEDKQIYPLVSLNLYILPKFLINFLALPNQTILGVEGLLQAVPLDLWATANFLYYHVFSLDKSIYISTSYLGILFV